MTTHVTLGANSIRDYEFLAPLSALIWRDRIGFHPIVLKTYVPGEAAQKRSVIAHEALLHHKLDFVMVPAVEGGPLWETGRTAQQSRELVGCLDLPDTDWAMPSDADLWPIKSSYYQQHYGYPGRVVSYYSNGDHYQTLPTCHVTMQLSKWRELYGVKAGDNMTAAIKRNCDAWMPVRRWKIWEDNFAMWMADQAIVSEKVEALPEKYVRIERRGHPPVDRIDRGNWQPLTEAIIDAHLLRPADQDSHWTKIRSLIGQIIPQHSAWADSYREAYIQGYCNA